ncbi:MAG: HprK-related kinase A, partial [Casimicrobiaceae bacterium]
EVADSAEYADVDLRLEPVRGLRRPHRVHVQFVVDGVTPFESFPVAHALPMFEWGLNWIFSHRMHDHLLLHAAAVERDGRALLLPAWPGSGKSTLAASLMCRGWRFLSDEFGVVSLADGRVRPFVRPAGLKNASIDVMRAFAPSAFIGPLFAATRKGDVAHLRADEASVRRGLEPAEAAAIVFPDFQAGEPVTVRPLGPSTAFLKLAGNAFNYEVVGEQGFRAVTSLVRRAPAHILRYGDLAQAHAAIDDLLRMEARA